MFINEARTLPTNRARARCFPVKRQNVFFSKIISSFGKVYQGYGLLCKEYKKQTKEKRTNKNNDNNVSRKLVN